MSKSTPIDHRLSAADQIEAEKRKTISNWPFPTELKSGHYNPPKPINPKQEVIDLIHDTMKEHELTVGDIEYFKKTPKERSKLKHKDVIKDILVTMKDEHIALDDLDSFDLDK